MGISFGILYGALLTRQTYNINCEKIEDYAYLTMKNLKRVLLIMSLLGLIYGIIILLINKESML